jgi:uncharacterized protein (TIGR04168 family)
VNQTIARPCKIAVVGDVHDQWDEGDERALQHLGVDLVLFVGDFGNESVEIVRAIAQVSLPKAAIFGNHDAWFTATTWGKNLRGLNHGDRVQQQLELLGEAHVGYGKRDFPNFRVSVVGGRPFSWGGPTWKNSGFYQQRFGVSGFAESTAKIVAAAQQASQEALIFMGHNGPQGLGSQPEDPCGKDWNPIGGDFGDPDLTDAIAQVRALGKQVPLVVFGHMHHSLRHTKVRLRTQLIVDDHGTVYLNAASVPRILPPGRDSASGGAACRSRNFSLVTLDQGRVTQATLVWIRDDLTLQSEQILYQSPHQSPEAIASEETKLLR